MIARIVQHLGVRYAHVFHWLRKLPEANYVTTKRRLRALIAERHPKRVLDAGCGTGEFATLFGKDAYLGADISESYLELARKLSPGFQFQAADLTTWKPEGAGFDLVLIHGLLHHLDDASSRAVLSNVAQVVAEDGVLLVVEDLDRPGFRPIEDTLHKLDVGEHIRNAPAWREIVGDYMDVEEEQTFHSGICPYIWFLGTPKK